MAKTKKAKKTFSSLNFSYFFTVSFLSLFSLFIILVAPFFSSQSLPSSVGRAPTVLQGQPADNYSLEPQPLANVQIQVNEGYGVNVLLKKDDSLVVDQDGFSYQWSVADSSVVEVNDYGMATACPYQINSPCPNLHADLTALKEGETVLTVKAFKQGQELAQTTFNLKVFSSDAQITYKIKFKGIDQRPANSSNQSVNVNGYHYGYIDNGVAANCRQFTKGGNEVAVDDSGVYTGSFLLNSCYIDKPGYKLCFKGPRHLQKCFKDVTLSRDQVLDFTGQPLEPGDLALSQDGKVDQADFNFLWDHRGSTDSNELAIGDLNLDGAINMGDVNLLLETLSVRYDQEGW